MKPSICLYEGHDTNITVYDPNTNSFYIYEFERVSGVKHHNVKEIKDLPSQKHSECINQILDHLLEVHGIENDFETFIFKPLFWDLSYIDRSAIKAGTITFSAIDHHDAHSWCAYAQSPFDKAASISWDGWGDNTSFKYSCFDGMDRYGVESKPRYKFSNIYTEVGLCISYLHGTYALDVPGKLMGLTAYGETNDDYVRLFKRSMLSESPIAPLQDLIPKLPIRDYREVPISEKADKLHAFNVAKSVQVAFEDGIIEAIRDEFMPMISEHGNNLIMSGGNALNVLANERIKREFPDVNIYIPPNTHDGGLSFGILYEHLQRNEKYDVTRSGPRLFDYLDIPRIVRESRGKKVTVDDITTLLKDQKIIGMCIGNMEVGPRALGNRSILCDASNPKMKDTLNCRVKFREWFRPFAPICRKEDAHKYFYSPNFENMECMQFVADVKPEHRTSLFSVTHYDDTARLQVVTPKSNKPIHDILTAFDGVLINTSFNVQGKPILNRLTDALDVLRDTGLDHVVVEYEQEYYLF